MHNKIVLTENHKRSLSSTLIVVEQILIDIEAIMVNSNQTCCYELKKDLDNITVEHNQKVIKEALALICILKEKYNTQKATQSVQRIIDAKKTKIWETIHNSKSRKIKGFGDFSQKIVNEYDSDLDRLLSITERIKL